MNKKGRGDSTPLGSIVWLAPEGYGRITCFLFGKISTSPDYVFTIMAGK